ncbi:MAG: SUMF1/EgtB/PvdO family nonheme iron enzyme, partial [Chloroflexi bacterium]|nr:SUMF1/EgtB/PvdO family nonheme iron enzyme [Chloroflexota bacterium]
ANYDETGIRDTSAVGCFPGGASPYGVEEMSGNVWEWTRSLWGKNLDKPDFKYPYDPRDGREDLQAPDDVRRVARGGAYFSYGRYVRCASRNHDYPNFRFFDIGVRVAVSPYL